MTHTFILYTLVMVTTTRQWFKCKHGLRILNWYLILRLALYIGTRGSSCDTLPVPRDTSASVLHSGEFLTT